MRARIRAGAAVAAAAGAAQVALAAHHSRMIRRPPSEPASGPAPSGGLSQLPEAWVLAGLAIAVVCLREIVEARAGGLEILDAVVAVAVCGLIVAAVAGARATGMATERRHSESETFNRIVRALSRALTADAVVGAVVYELGMATEADHVAVARLGPAGILDVTFVSMLPGSATSRTSLQPGPAAAASVRPVRGGARTWSAIDPGSGEKPPAAAEAESEGRARNLAESIAGRLREAYGLRNTLAAPLRADGATAGAIVLSRRTGEIWPQAATRLLFRAAGEASAALDRVRTQEAAESEARTDPLTGLANRRYFDEYVRVLASRRRTNDRVAVLSADIDHFKLLNDRFGHGVGDAVLRAVADAITASIREDDFPVRSGGEEFVVLLRNPAEGVALAIGERMRQSVRDLDLRWAGLTDPVTISVGVATGLSTDEAVGEILERADRAMYAAKRAGRDRVVEARLAPVAR